MQRLKEILYNSQKFNEIELHNNEKLFLTGLSGSIISFIISYIREKQNKKIIFCSNDETRLFRIKDDINVILKNIDADSAIVHLSKYDEEYENDISSLSEVLKRLSDDDSSIILTNPDFFNKDVVSESNFKEKTIVLEKGKEYDYDELIIRLLDNGFNKNKIVEGENEFAVRGGIIDIFPENLSQPVRIEFFGNLIESIREFDVTAQRSISQLDKVNILPNLEDENGSTITYNKATDYIDNNTLIIIDEPDIIIESNPELPSLIDKYDQYYVSTFSIAKSTSVMSFTSQPKFEINFNSKSQPNIQSNIKLLYNELAEYNDKDYTMFLTSSDDYLANRFKGLVEDLDEENKLIRITFTKETINNGFILPDINLVVLTEHEIFGRYYKASKRKRKFAGITFKELGKVNYGDYMVHETFGIGKYAGLHKIVIGGVEQEAVKLLYLSNDTLFVNLNSIHQIKKYSGQEGHVPKITRLGGNEWEKIKQRTKKKIIEIAQDLIQLYSQRKALKGFRFSQDTVWQKELEASFIYEDTPDQITATESVKQDMESENPMDRLICGDVGFGKTEVAIRAAFKCVLDNKQAAVLVPTTILAEQHYNTFKDRLSNWAVEVQHLSRFKTKKEQNEIVAKLEKGTINIIIGTHRLLSKDIKFKDLGLLVIDEEQRFGVKAKEKLKTIKTNVDVLTLTATPIPRTLNFSLLGARDLSIINTPPKNRQPIHTEIINLDKKIISSGIIRELQRNGQVYFVSDKISQLDKLAFMIEEMVPFAKVAIAHGQMKPTQLEKIMLGFLEKKYNVLVCTKIIESGLDIPSVNTIIINRADNFGLAELYQLRGRVGRSNIKSFAYLISPPQSTLTKQAIRRLHALEEFTELGSGMNLALKDLEIRGAGNLLGKEQSGFINEIGFDLYMQLLNEAVFELKGSITDITGKKETTEELLAELKRIESIQIETDVSSYIPEYYIEDENTRLEIYQKFSKVIKETELNEIKDELYDRFGKFPDEVASLFLLVNLKLECMKLEFNKLSINSNEASININLMNEKFFTSGKFEKIINYLNENKPKEFKLLQTKDSLILKYYLNKENKGYKKLESIFELFKTLENI